MHNIIFSLQYIRDAPPVQFENYVHYIGTREGVEKKVAFIFKSVCKSSMIANFNW